MEGEGLGVWKRATHSFGRLYPESVLWKDLWAAGEAIWYDWLRYWVDYINLARNLWWQDGGRRGMEKRHPNFCTKIRNQFQVSI